MYWKTLTLNVFLSLLFMVENYHIEHNPGKAASYQNVEIKINQQQVVPIHTDTAHTQVLRKSVVPNQENTFYPKLAFKPSDKQPHGYAVYENQDEGQYQANGNLSKYQPSRLNQDIFRRTPFSNVNRIIANGRNIASSNRILLNTDQHNLYRQLHP